MRRAPAIAAVLMLALSPLTGQTRTLDSQGASLTLAEGWSWIEEKEDDSLAALKDISQDGARGRLSCQLEKAKNPFVGQELNSIRDFVDREPSLSKFAVEENGKIAGRSDVLIATYIQRPEGGTARIVKRWIIDHHPDPLVWIETTPESIAGPAEAAWTEIRRSVKLSKVKGDKPIRKRTYVEQGARFQLPKGWIWIKGARGPKVRLDDSKSWQQLFGARTCIVEDGRGYSFSVYLSSNKSSETPDKFMDRNRDNLTKNLDDIKDSEVADTTFRGKKAVRLSFTAVEKGGSGGRLRWDHYAFKNKGRLFHWQETTDQPTQITKRMRKEVQSKLRL